MRYRVGGADILAMNANVPAKTARHRSVEVSGFLIVAVRGSAIAFESAIPQLCRGPRTMPIPLRR